jgi:hypothetical protein
VKMLQFNVEKPIFDSSAKISSSKAFNRIIRKSFFSKKMQYEHNIILTESDKFLPQTELALASQNHLSTC